MTTYEARSLVVTNVEAGGQPFGSALTKDGLLTPSDVNGDEAAPASIEVIRIANGAPPLPKSQLSSRHERDTRHG